MMWRKVFLLILLTSLSRATRECGRIKVEKPTALINNGNASYPGQWPWLASLFNATDDVFLCGSTIISKWHLLTAAHCVVNPKPDGRYALLGRFDLTNSSETHWQRRDISEFYSHIDFNPAAERQMSKGDIAVLKMSESVEFTDYIQPICLPDATTNVINVKGITSGYGSTNPNDIGTENKPSHVELKSIDRFVCMSVAKNYIHIVSEMSFCAGNKKAITCKGDSGGGFYIYNKPTLQYQIIGVVSFSLVHCEPSENVVYTDVTKYLPWIYEKTDLTDKCFKMNCGENEECRADLNGQALCLCPPEFIGSPPHCMQKCSKDADCPDNRSCFKDTCVDYCSNSKIVCAKNANCIVKNHESECECKDGYIGDGQDCELDSNFIDGYFKYFEDQIDYKCTPFCIEKFLTFLVRNSIGSPSNQTEIIPSNRNETVEMIKIDDKSFIPNTNYLPIKIDEIFPRLKKYIVESQSLKAIRGENFVNLNKLEKLEITDNRLELIVEEFAFDDLIQLKELSLSGNKMTNLPEDLFENNAELVHINLNNNRLTSINLIKNLTKLLELELSNNELEALSDDVFNNLQKLEILFLDGTQIKSIPEKIFENLPFLKVIELSSNQLVEIPENLFVKNTRLEIIDLSGNRIASLNSNTFHALTELKTLNLHWNKLTTLPEDIFMLNTKITDLNLANNKISNLTSNIFNSLHELEELDISWNQLTTLPDDIFSENVKLEKIFLRANDIASLTSDVFKNLFQLEEIYLNYNNLVTLPENIFRVNLNIEGIYLSNNNLSSISWKDFEKKPKLNCVSLIENACVNAEFGCYLHQLLSYSERGSLKSTLKSKCKV